MIDLTLWRVGLSMMGKAGVSPFTSQTQKQQPVLGHVARRTQPVATRLCLAASAIDQ
jgi:hypothetical protein